MGSLLSIDILKYTKEGLIGVKERYRRALTSHISKLPLQINSVVYDFIDKLEDTMTEVAFLVDETDLKLKKDYLFSSKTEIMAVCVFISDLQNGVIVISNVFETFVDKIIHVLNDTITFLELELREYCA